LSSFIIFLRLVSEQIAVCGNGGGFKNFQPQILSITSLIGQIWTYKDKLFVSLDFCFQFYLITYVCGGHWHMLWHVASCM